MGPQLIAGKMDKNGQMDKNGLDNGSTIGYSNMVWYGKPKRKFRQPIYGGKSMKLSMVVLTMVSAAVMASGAGIGFNACPAVGADTAGCEMLVSVTAVSSLGVGTAFFVATNSPDQGPFDGVEDTLIGIQNNSLVNALKSITLTSSSTAIAGFDGDGACIGTYAPGPTAAQCLGGVFTSTDPNDYESAGVTFSGFTSGGSTITINFAGAGLAASNGTSCGSAWFDVENAPTAGSFGGGTAGTTCASVGPGTPEPASAMLLAPGLVALALLARKRRAAR
jgi:hypothetical protein